MFCVLDGRLVSKSEKDYRFFASGGQNCSKPCFGDDSACVMDFERTAATKVFLSFQTVSAYEDEGKVVEEDTQ